MTRNTCSTRARIEDMLWLQRLFASVSGRCLLAVNDAVQNRPASRTKWGKWLMSETLAVSVRPPPSSLQRSGR